MITKEGNITFWKDILNGSKPGSFAHRVAKEELERLSKNVHEQSNVSKPKKEK